MGREMKKKKEIEKIGLRVDLYFFMGIFNGVYREINGGVKRISLDLRYFVEPGDEELVTGGDRFYCYNLVHIRTFPGTTFSALNSGVRT